MRISYRAARVNKGLTLEEASKELGISIGCLSNYENGKTFPKVNTVYKMSNLYEVPFDFLVDCSV